MVPSRSMFPEFFVPGLTAFLLTAVVLQLLLARAHRFLPVDRPNERSLHARPIPRFGGLAILVGSALALALPGGVAPLWLWPIPVLAAISLLDDFLTLPAVPRFAPRCSRWAARWNCRRATACCW